MSKATSESNAPNDEEAPEEAVKFAYSLPHGEFIRLDDAINFPLLRLRPDRRNASGVFEQKASIARPGAILFGVQNSEQEQALILEFEEKLSEAAFTGEVRFKGVKVPPGKNDRGDDLIGATGLEWIPASEFGETRGFDAERCRITVTSYNIDGPDLEDALERSLLHADAYGEWTNVVVEGKGYLQWLGREYPTILGRPPKAGKKVIREFLEEEKQKRGEPLDQAEAYEFIRKEKGYADSRDVIREVAKRVADGRGPGRPRKSPG